MFDRDPRKLALWLLVGGGAFALMGTALPASQQTTHVPVPITSAATPTAEPALDMSVDHQMAAFQRHARVNMILYSGQFHPGARLDAVALTLKTVNTRSK